MVRGGKEEGLNAKIDLFFRGGETDSELIVSQTQGRRRTKMTRSFLSVVALVSVTLLVGGQNGAKCNMGFGRITKNTPRLSISRLKRRGERVLPCAMPESTQGGETEPPRRTCDKVPHRKLASRCHRNPVTPKSKRRTRVASTQQESKAF